MRLEGLPIALQAIRSAIRAGFDRGATRNRLHVDVFTSNHGRLVDSDNGSGDVL